ncbi:hypothetical protein [Candidatus Nitrosotenuis uzonensis]|uniref:Uncharacterized protein n=1 Tax=Candidatus Nitrosotenuis uzonensis TaxID=1407055 RepID=A0A812ETX2_9ARCH|nr:hypothetical protein [Candidatus Nitrosotenuis uzonensis]CAE6485970.1 conserved hypothetical protein [Candidatus Nitrosotenuis uzonensis]
MATHKPEEEAIEILEIIQKYFPKIFEARDSIKWLHKHTTQGNQKEWAAIFFEEYCRPLLTNFLGGWYGVRIIKGSRIDYQRNYNWDLKVHSIKDNKGKSQSQIILNDKDAMERIIELESGIGFIVADVDFTFDMSGSLSRWRDQYEGRTKKHSKNARIMKNRGKVIGLKAFFIKDKSILKKGINEKWISIFKQGRQPDGSPRKPKYMINLDKIPDELITHLDAD